MVLTPVVVGGWELEVGFVGGIGVGIEACGGKAIVNWAMNKK